MNKTAANYWPVVLVALLSVSLAVVIALLLSFNVHADGPIPPLPSPVIRTATPMPQNYKVYLPTVLKRYIYPVICKDAFSRCEGPIWWPGTPTPTPRIPRPVSGQR